MHLWEASSYSHNKTDGREKLGRHDYHLHLLLLIGGVVPLIACMYEYYCYYCTKKAVCIRLFCIVVKHAAVFHQ